MSRYQLELLDWWRRNSLQLAALCREIVMLSQLANFGRGAGPSAVRIRPVPGARLIIKSIADPPSRKLARRN